MNRRRLSEVWIGMVITALPPLVALPLQLFGRMLKGGNGKLPEVRKADVDIPL